MPKYYITHVEPLHPLKGEEVLFFIREKEENKPGKTHLHLAKIPHRFYTKPLEGGEAFKINEELKRDFPNRQLYHQQFTHKTVTLSLRGSKEERKILPEPFICKKDSLDKRDPFHLNSPSRQLRWLYTPFTQLDSLTDITYYPNEEKERKLIDLETLLQDTHATIDLELENWEMGKDQISQVIYLSTKRKIIFHNLPFDEEKKEDCILQRFTTQQDLGEKLSQVIAEDDPLWLFGHNLMAFDQIKLRKLTTNYYPAPNHHYPITKSAAALRRVITKGRWTLDTFGYHFNYRNLLSNNRLETISGLLKSINYQEQADLIKKARQGNAAAFHSLLHYLYEDGLYAQKAALEVLETAAAKARYFRRAPDDICTASPKTISEEYWDRHYFLKRGNYNLRNAAKKSRQRTADQTEPNYIEELTDSLSAGQLQKGFFSEGISVIYLTPLLAGSASLVEKMAPDISTKFKQSTNSLEKYDCLRTLEYLLYPFLEIIFTAEENKEQEILKPSKLKDQFQLSPNLQKKISSTFYSTGLEEIDAYNWIKGLKLALEQSQKALHSHNLINYGGSLVFINGEINYTKLEQNYFGTYLGQGPALSLNRNRIVANPFNESNPARFLYQSLDIQSGGKTNFEKRIYSEAIKKIFSKESILNVSSFLRTEQKQFIRGKAEEKAYHISRGRRTYYKNQLGNLLEFSGQKPEIIESYLNLKPRITSTMSDETKEELIELIELCQNTYAYPYLKEECLEQILNPYPQKIELVYDLACKGELIPKELSSAPDLAAYRDKITPLFKEFIGALRPRQMDLFEKSGE
ncbi:hypothetical protein HYU21_04320 [Candidatus Woesearchaeota archaeon]|nr:hypothetical protein [Candidatus Woesearchaeota archaeon]